MKTEFLKVIRLIRSDYGYSNSEIVHINISNISILKGKSFDDYDHNKRDIKTEITYNNCGKEETYYSKLTVDELLDEENNDIRRINSRFDILDIRE